MMHASLLRADDMHDALSFVLHSEVREACRKSVHVSAKIGTCDIKIILQEVEAGVAAECLHIVLQRYNLDS